MATKSEIKLDLMPNQVKALNINSMTNKITENDLKSFGISMDSAVMPEIGQYYGFAFDAAPALQTKATITNTTLTLGQGQNETINGYNYNVGGAIYTNNATITLINTTFNQNNATTEGDQYGFGGAIHWTGENGKVDKIEIYILSVVRNTGCGK